MTGSDRPIRVLHVIGSLCRGGAETLLMHALRIIPRSEVAIDFLVHREDQRPHSYEEEARRLGAEVRMIGTSHRRPIAYARALRKRVQENRCHDIIHSHVGFFSGFVLRVAKSAGVPVRIAHCHNTDLTPKQQTNAARRAYASMMRHWIGSAATAGFACSGAAGKYMFGEQWEHDPRWNLLPNCIDLDPFRRNQANPNLRKELGIPDGALVIGHVGRFASEKNHRFVVEVAAEVFKQEPAARLLLVGDGFLRPDIEVQVEKMGIKERIVFAGIRTDVPQLLRHVIDVFLLPSLCEGFPLVLLEAQAAGSPSVLSSAIPEEIDLVNPLMRRVDLERSSTEWADAVLEACHGPPVPGGHALRVIEEAGFDAHSFTDRLIRFYRQYVNNPSKADLT